MWRNLKLGLLRFTRNCVEKILAKNSARGEKMTNIRYGIHLFPELGGGWQNWQNWPSVLLKQPSQHCHSDHFCLARLPHVLLLFSLTFRVGKGWLCRSGWEKSPVLSVLCVFEKKKVLRLPPKILCYGPL